MRHIGDLNFQGDGQLFRHGVDFHFGVNNINTDADLDPNPDDGDVVVTLDDHKINSYRGDIHSWRKYCDNTESPVAENHNCYGVQLTYSDAGKLHSTHREHHENVFILPRAIPGIRFSFCKSTEYWSAILASSGENIEGSLVIKYGGDGEPYDRIITIQAVTNNTWCIVEKDSDDEWLGEPADEPIFLYDRCVFAGGSNGTWIDQLRCSIPDDGAYLFGWLRYGFQNGGSCSNSYLQRGLIFSGWNNSMPDRCIDCINLLTNGNSSLFGYTVNRYQYGAATDNGILNRGVIVGSFVSNYSSIEYMTISTLGNSLDFGDLTVGRRHINQATSNDIYDRGIIAGGNRFGPNVNVIDYITISTTGNAIDFGDMLTIGHGWSATSNGCNQCGVFFSSSGNNYRGEYLNINSLSNAIIFSGSLPFSAFREAAISNKIGNKAIICSNNFQTWWYNILTLTSYGTFCNLTNNWSHHCGIANS